MKIKKIVNICLILALVIALVWRIFGVNESVGRKAEILSFIPSFLMGGIAFLLTAINPKEIDSFLDKINIFGLPSIPKKQSNRIKYFRVLGFVLSIFAFLVALVLVVEFFKTS